MGKMDVHFSSEDMTWETPQSFYDKYDAKYHFVWDLACTEFTCKAPDGYMFDRGEDAFQHPWHEHKGWLWLNPEYGRAIKKWMKKAYEESLLGARIVCLVPSRTDTQWWHDYAMKGKVEFIKGRLKFGNAKNSAPFPSAVVIFGGGK